MRRAAERVGRRRRRPPCCAPTSPNAMDDDLGTPAAVAAIHETVRQGNTALADGDDAAVAGALGSVRAMLGVLGPGPARPAVGGRLRRPAGTGHRRPRRPGPRAAPGRPRPQGLRGGRRDPGPAHRPRRLRRGHPPGTPMGADPLMAGNSQRRGRTTGAGKKGATAGTGGKNRRSLAGRGATPPAEARPGHPAQRRATADANGSGPTAPAPVRGPRRPPSCCSGAIRSSRRCGRRSPPTRSTSSPGTTCARPTSGSPRPWRWPRTAGCRCSRWARRSSTGCPRARCTRASGSRCRPTTTPTPTTCWTWPATRDGRR